MSESTVLGKDGKSHKVNICNQCKKEFYFGENPKKGQPNEKDWVKLNFDGSPHVDAKTFQPRKPSETFRYIHWVKINEGVADQFEVSRTGNLGELDAIKTFGELKEIIARLPK